MYKCRVFFFLFLSPTPNPPFHLTCLGLQQSECKAAINIRDNGARPKIAPFCALHVLAFRSTVMQMAAPRFMLETEIVAFCGFVRNWNCTRVVESARPFGYPYL